MDCTDAGEPGEFLLVAGRNNSLSSAGRAVVLESLVVVCLAISLAFAFQGAWLVLPFAAAKMFVLLLAFRFIEQPAGDFESIAIKGDRVLVEMGNRTIETVRVQPLPGAGGCELSRPGRQIDSGAALPRARGGAWTAFDRRPEGCDGADAQATVEKPSIV